MRRILTLVLAVGLGLVAVSLVAPDAAPFPEFGTTVPPEPDGAVGDSSVWYCSLVDSGAVHDSSFELATAVDVDGLITLPTDYGIRSPGFPHMRVAFRGQPGPRSTKSIRIPGTHRGAYGGSP